MTEHHHEPEWDAALKLAREVLPGVPDQGESRIDLGAVALGCCLKGLEEAIPCEDAAGLMRAFGLEMRYYVAALAALDRIS